MKPIKLLEARLALAQLGVAGAALLAGCAASPNTEVQAAAARASARLDWKLELEWAGSNVEA